MSAEIADAKMIQELKVAALAATPGPWQVKKWGYFITGVITAYKPTKERFYSYGCGNDFVCDLDDGEHHQYCDKDEREANAVFIAAANPAAILALITKVERLEKEADWLAEVAVSMDKLLCDGDDRPYTHENWRESAREAIAERDAQEASAKTPGDPGK